MFLSYLLVDTAADPARPRPGRSWVRQPYRVHQRLCMGFPTPARKARDQQFLDPFLPDDFLTLTKVEEEHDGKTHVHQVRDKTTGLLFRIDLVAVPWRAAGARAAEWRDGVGIAPPSRHIITVQSAIAPDWKYAFQNAREFLCAEPLVKDYAPTCEVGQKHRFILRANPTTKIDTPSKAQRLEAKQSGIKLEGQNGRRVGLVTEAEQVRWLLRKGEAGGFTIPGEWVDAKHPETGAAIQFPNFRVEVIPEGRDRNGKPGHVGEFLAVRFEGVLVVTDADLFRAALAAGIGSGKAFGFGLLSVAPCV